MYTALIILFCGMLLGRIFRRFLSPGLLRGLISFAIFLLLFLLGVSLGGNSQLLEKLPVFGLQAIILSLLAIAGSIVCCYIGQKFFWKNRSNSPKNSTYS